MLGTDILNNYTQLKNKMDASYILLRKDPSIINVTRHTTATQAFNAFCVDTMKELTGVHQESSNKQAEILQDLNTNSTETGTTSRYLTCKSTSCGGQQLIFPLGEPGRYTGFIESMDFVPEFPGWCHRCLVEHCNNMDTCENCTIPEELGFGTFEQCPYKEVRMLYKNT